MTPVVDISGVVKNYSGLRPLRRDVRRDAGAHRTRWQFAERVVEVGVMPAGMPA